MIYEIAPRLGIKKLILKKSKVIMDWILQNKMWLFSGIAISLPVAIITWIISNKKKHIKQVQKSGKKSLNIQAGHDIDIKINSDEKNE